jgi:hypothetical protein
VEVIEPVEEDVIVSTVFAPVPSLNWSSRTKPSARAVKLARVIAAEPYDLNHLDAHELVPRTEATLPPMAVTALVENVITFIVPVFNPPPSL